MRKVYAAMCIGIAGLFGLAFWKNCVSYPHKTRKWRLVKGGVDCSLVVLSAIYLPGLLVYWIVGWITGIFVNRPAIRQTAAILAAILFHSIGGYVIEALCVLGIFAVDLFTGKQGIYGWWTEGPPRTFIKSWAPKEN